jgi:malate/lactate dehydrogenase
MIYFYKWNSKYLFSFTEYNCLKSITEEEAKENSEELYFLNKMDPLFSRKSYLISNPQLLFIVKEGVELLLKDKRDYSHKLPSWILEKIKKNLVISVNTAYPKWKDVLKTRFNNKWTVNLVALGDVGSTLLIGLRLLGGKHIEKIGIYDRNENRLKRWEQELNQIVHPTNPEEFPPIVPIPKEKLFDCDMFVFCASKGVPPIDSQVDDVRMAQFEANKEIIREYAVMARDENFKGIFAVVSDPVDLLCKVAFLESNKDDKGNLDFNGLASNQIIGYGLGVMNARACYHAKKSKDTIHFIKEGRVFGPHGEGLIVADSIINYDKKLSDYLTYKTLNTNKDIRNLGYKPYVAPSLSSGALSIIATINGDWFYGSTYMGGAYMGARCRLINGQLEVEQLELPIKLFEKIKLTHERLVSIL